MQIVRCYSDEYKSLKGSFSNEDKDYLQVLESLKNEVYFILDTKHNALFPFSINNKHVLFKQAYTPWFVQTFKPLGYVRVAFLENCAVYLKKHFGKVNLRLPSKDAKTFTDLGFNTIKRTSYQVNFVKTKLNSNHKRSLKKAEKLGYKSQTLAVYEAIDFLRAELFHRIENFNEEQVENFIYYTNKLESFGLLKVLGVRGALNELVGVAIFYKEGKLWHYLKGTANTVGRENGAMHLIFIRFLEGLNNDEYLDFNGSDVPGVAKFYEGFGAEKYYYSEINYQKYPRISKLIRKLR